MNFNYPFTIKKSEDGSYFVQFIDIEEAFTSGETIEEAVFNAKDVLNLMLEERLDKEDEIPEASESDSSYKVAPSATVQAAILVRKSRKNTTLADLARALNTSWPAAKRLEDPRHAPTLKQLERALNALGKRLILSVSD